MPLNIIFDAPLVDLNTMAIPARAQALLEVSSLDEMVEALLLAKSKSWQTLILGEGSNVLFTGDFVGLVILNRIMGVDVLEEHDDFVLLRVGSGENWHRLVEDTVSSGWYGLENLALIPGLVGAAPVQNIGAYGVEVKDSIVSVAYLDLRDQKPHSLDCAQCQFSYRDSIFKKELSGKVVITSVEFKLFKTAQVSISYPSLAKALEVTTEQTPISVFNAVCALRNSKLPAPSVIPNAGSFFKNPVVSKRVFQSLKLNYPQMPAYSVPSELVQSQTLPSKPSTSMDSTEKNKLAAGWLIEKAGWKGKVIDRVKVHDEQALVIVNPDGASGDAVLNFAKAVQKDIYEKFGVQLEIEPQLI